MTRRDFLGRSAPGVALASTLAGASAAQPGSKAVSGAPNPYAYPDITRPTDPTLLHYDQLALIACPRPEARRIATDPKGNLLVLAEKYLTTLDADGPKLAEIILAAPGTCVTTASDGTIFVGFKDHIEVYDAAGTRKAVWDAPAKKGWFTGLAVSEQEVFASDATNRTVLRYDRSGKFLGRIGEKDVRQGIPGFVVPSPYFDLKLGSDGLLRVANPGRHRVETYTQTGHLEFSWGKTSTRIEGFCGCCNPIAIALLPEGRVVTCEKGIARVKVYSARGELLSVVAAAESFPENSTRKTGGSTTHSGRTLDVAVGASDRIYVLDWAANKVRVMGRKKDAPDLTT